MFLTKLSSVVDFRGVQQHRKRGRSIFVEMTHDAVDNTNTGEGTHRSAQNTESMRNSIIDELVTSVLSDAFANFVAQKYHVPRTMRVQSSSKRNNLRANDVKVSRNQARDGGVVSSQDGTEEIDLTSIFPYTDRFWSNERQVFDEWKSMIASAPAPGPEHRVEIDEYNTNDPEGDDEIEIELKEPSPEHQPELQDEKLVCEKGGLSCFPLECVALLLPWCTTKESIVMMHLSRDIRREVHGHMHELCLMPYRFNITNEVLTHLLSPEIFPNITHLIMTGCSLLSDEALKVVGENAKDSQVLSLKGCTDVTDEGLGYIACCKLKQLDLGYCSKVTDEGLRHISKLRGLETLNLRSCRKVTSAGIQILGNVPLLKLRQLNLWYTSQGMLSDSALSAIQNFENLEELVLSNCTRLTDKGVAYLSSLVRLKKLELANCGEITDDGLLKLSTLSQLQKLDLSGCWQLTDKGMDALKSFKRLDSLNLWYCANLTDATLITLCQLREITYLNLMKVAKITDLGLSFLAKNLVKLRTLDLVNCNRLTDCALTAMCCSIPSMHQLERLSLGSCSSIADHGVQQLSRLSHLTHLDLSNCRQLTDNALLWMGKLPKLASLNLLRCSRITDAGVAYLEDLCDSLKTLNLSSCREISDEGLRSIGKLTKLETLSLWYCCKITDKGLHYLSNMEDIVSIDLANCKELTDDGLEIFKYFWRLTSLDLGNCSKLTDDGMAKLSKHLPHLSTLNIAECEKITDEGLRHLKSMPSLRSINAWYCSRITTEGVVDVMRNGRISIEQ